MDYFRAGPIEGIRVNNTNYFRSTLTAEGFDQLVQHLSSHLDEVVFNINNSISIIAEIVRTSPPGLLLQRAYWECASKHLKISSEAEIGSDQAIAMRMVDYIQSVVASVQHIDVTEDRVADETWCRLYAEVEKLFSSLMIEYFICRSSNRRKTDPQFDSFLDEFQVQAEMLWVHVRGVRYSFHEKTALLEILEPHSDILLQLFGVDACTLVGELGKILHKLIFGIDDVLKELNDFHKDFIVKVSEIGVGYDDFETAVQLVTKSTDFAERAKPINDELFGLDMFDVEKITNLPRSFLDELTWSPGEEKGFFSEKEYCGWPLKVWPIMQRPFLKVDNHIYCFNLFALFDNFYRVIQSIIFRLAPDYKETWNIRQQQITEELPLRYFKKILPGANIINSIYYRWNPGGSKANWNECDGLIIYDDYLFIVEIKAGSFTRSSPTTDLDAQIKSLANLIQNPSLQGERFINYLMSSDEIPIFDSNHKETGRLCRSQFNNIIVCAITLDSLTSIAARAQQIRNLGLNISSQQVWSISIDDLRVYADFFLNPLVFLHFVENRMRAARSKHVNLNDELDHLGLYLQLNNYTSYIENLSTNEDSRINCVGYRTPIDNYYKNLMLNSSSAVPPQQSMPTRLREIVDCLAESKRIERSQISNLLLGLDNDTREKFTHSIDEILLRIKEIERPLPGIMYGEQNVIYIVSCPAAKCSMEDASDYAMTMAVQNQSSGQLVLLLNYTDKGILSSLDWQTVSPLLLSPVQLSLYRQKSEAQSSRRVTLARARKKIKPNEKCPCGSGKKYKKCCNP